MKNSTSSDYLVIDNDSSLWITHRISATTVPMAKRNVASIAYHLKNKGFSNIYVYQHIEVDEKTGLATVRKDDDLGPDFVLEPVREERFNILVLSRLSRVVSVRVGDTVQKATEPVVVPLRFKDSVDADRVRNQYMENFIKQLP